MKISLTSWLQKRGIEKEEDLSPEEKVVFDKYKLLLTGEVVTVETLKAFCQSQLAIVIAACDGKNPITPIQQAGIHIYTNLIKAIEAPLAERESLERMLEAELR